MYVYLLDSNKFNVYELNFIMHQLGYINETHLFYHYRKPENDLDFNIFTLRNDPHALMLSIYFSKKVDRCLD